MVKHIGNLYSPNKFLIHGWYSIGDSGEPTLSACKLTESNDHSFLSLLYLAVSYTQCMFNSRENFTIINSISENGKTWYSWTFPSLVSPLVDFNKVMTLIAAIVASFLVVIQHHWATVLSKPKGYILSYSNSLCINTGEGRSQTHAGALGSLVKPTAGIQNPTVQFWVIFG